MLQSSRDGRAALAKANEVLRVYSAAHPEMIRSEFNYPFVECATFADQIKEKGIEWKWQNGWHFIDTPYLDQGGSLQDYPKFIYDPNSIDKAVGHIYDWIAGNSNYTDNFVYNNITRMVPDPKQAESFALRLLIHYIGDIHQPLHAAARINPTYPKGDMGGNLFKIPEDKGVTNLHSLWDSILYEFVGTPNMPFTYDDWMTLGQNTTKMEQAYSFNANEWETFSPTQWALESFEMSKSNVYAGISENTQPNAEYLSSANYQLKRNIVLGGLRLSQTIIDLYG